MGIQQNDLYIITKDSFRYKSLYKQYILLIDPLDHLNKEHELKTIENFIIYLTIYTNIRKIHRIETKHLILFAREQIRNCRDQTSEEILRDLVKALTNIKKWNKLKTDVSLMNYKFWCEVLK